MFHRHVSPAVLALLVAPLIACGSTSSVATDAAGSLAAVEVVATFSDTRPGNIAVTPAGRIFMTQHPLDNPTLRVVEVLPDGTKVPFPNQEWSDGPSATAPGFASTIGIASDTKGVVWVLDMGSASSPAQFVAWDTVSNKLHKRIELPQDVIVATSFLQDFALDEQRGRIYIADMTFAPPGTPAEPAFVVVNTETGTARRVLQGGAPLMPVARDVVIGGSLVGTSGPDGAPAGWHLGLNPIAIDPSFEWVYFGTINGPDVFRVPADTLANASASASSVLSKIERYGAKPPCDGIAVDGKGRVFITDIEGSAVGISTPGGYRVIAQDDTKLSWPDGFALTADGWLYVTQNQLHAHPALNEGKDESTTPYRIVRLRP